MEPNQQAAAAAAADDRLTSLPAVLQDEILVRLDLRGAVRTSALSRAWRDLWKSLSVLSLSCPPGTHPSAVDSVVLRYTGPRVSLFDVYIDYASADRVGDWLIALSRCRVESIRMRSRSVHYFNLHSSIFSFAHLVSLRLQGCTIPLLPIGFDGFPVLQVLGLNVVHFPANGENQLEAIIRRSPLIHTLHMSDVRIPRTCLESVIEAPNLHTLTIHLDDDDGWRIGELPCLEDADISVEFHLPKFGDLLAQFARVRNLKLVPTVDDVEMPYALPFTFYNLKKLTLYLDFTLMHHVLCMFTLLRSCQNLEELEIEIRYDDRSIEANWEFLNPQWTDGMCVNLQVVKIIRIKWLPNEISFMKLILSKARLLRTLHVDKCPYHFDDPLVDLLKCRRASAEARVLFEGLDQQY